MKRLLRHTCAGNPKAQAHCPACLSGELAIALKAEPPEPPPPPRRLEVIKPSMSKTDRFLACAYPWGREAPRRESGQAARFGTAVHEVLEQAALRKKFPGWGAISTIAKKHSLGGDVSPAEVMERASASQGRLRTWLAGDNPWDTNFWQWRLMPEVSFAYNITTGGVRGIKLERDSHDYRVVLPEFPGTADLVGWGGLRQKKHVLVLDHKTGFVVGAPMESGQLLSLALAAARFYGAEAAVVAFLHAPDGIRPEVYADSFDSGQLNDHAEALRAAYHRDGDTLKPGPWCQYCDAASICPTNATALAEVRVGNMRTGEEVGAAHQRLQGLRRRFAELEGIVDAEIRTWIIKNGAALRPDGQAVDFVEVERRALSLSSITEHLGPLKGGALIKKLEKMGVVRTKKRKELRVVR